MINSFLIPENTVISAKGDGAAVDISGASNRVFLLSLNIGEIIEQESLDVSVFASNDGTTWSAKPVTYFPQKFYRAEHPLLLDLTGQPTVKFLRAHWEVARWGRGDMKPMFKFGVSIREVPADVLKAAATEAQALA